MLENRFTFGQEGVHAFAGVIGGKARVDLAALEAQGKIRAMNGTQNTWFAGAWMRNGFHEDGFASAYDVVQAMRARTAEGQLAA